MKTTSRRHAFTIAAALALASGVATAGPAQAGKLYDRPVRLSTGGTNLAIFSGTGYYNAGVTKLNGRLTSQDRGRVTAILEYRRQYRRASTGAWVNGGVKRVSTKSARTYYSGSLRPGASGMSHFRLKARVCWWQPGMSSCSSWSNATPWVRTR